MADVEKLLFEILPVVLTGIITFFVTRYTMSWNVPLDNMKISYNRVYYPLYKKIRDVKYENVDHNELQNLMDNILLKYDKYISTSTMRTYKNYRKASNREKSISAKSEFNQFCENIISYNTKLRGKLGYVRAGYYDVYKSLPKIERKWLCLSMAVGLLYIVLMLFSVFQWEWTAYIIIFCLPTSLILSYILCYCSLNIGYWIL